MSIISQSSLEKLASTLAVVDQRTKTSDSEDQYFEIA